mgnify:CR=1 FL=1
MGVRTRNNMRAAARKRVEARQQVQVRRDVVKRWAAHRDIIASNS